MNNRQKKYVQDSKVSEEHFPLSKRNFLWILVGLLLMVLGYLLMIGGGTKDPNLFSGEQMFSVRRIVLAPLLIFAGFVFEIWAIMYKKKDK